MRPLSFLLIAYAFLLAAILPPQFAYAQSNSSEGIEHVIEAAREAGVSIIVIDGAAEPVSVAQDGGAALSDRAAQLAHTISVNLKQTLADLLAAPETLPATIAAVSPNGSAGWPWLAMVVAVLSLLAGWGAERVLLWLMASRSILSAPLVDAARSARIRFILLGTLIEGLLLAGGLVLALLLAVSFIGDDDANRTVILSIFEAAAYVRALLLFFRAMLVPYSPDAQLLGISHEDANHLYVTLRNGLWLAGGLFAIVLWLTRIGAADGLIVSVTIVMSFLVAMILARTAWSLQLSITRVSGDGIRRASWLVRNWHLVVSAYLCAAVIATALGQLAGANTHGIVIAPVTAAIMTAIFYAFSLLIVDSAFAASKVSKNVRGPTFRHWAERSALIIASSVALYFVLGAWGVGFFRADDTVRPVYTILLISIVAYIGWSAIHTAFDRKIAQERELAGPVAEDGEEGGAGGTRLATLLPLFRNAILIAILVLALMVVLSAIGVDIAPLFAGAGLIGFAIGFGSQTLVKDIFSGIFFLIDDAFRVGEYIETGSAKGTVEKISIRSMQLRHQNGPLHNIPFGDITTLTNYSRDWVIMKLPIRVRFGTDTERVRKLIKKLGQELLEHPVIGDKFVDPLKSQGVYKVDELGIITRVKFKTKPGDQFAVRKVVYQKINELFEREGIAFGGREVVVRTADDRQDGKPSPSTQEMAGAAAEASDTGQPGTARNKTT
jgi:small-conductance mechanosensitive channel